MFKRQIVVSRIRVEEFGIHKLVLYRVILKKNKQIYKGFEL